MIQPRSWLFVPADSDKKVAKALESDSDAIIFDLEDSVAPRQKAAARDILKGLPARSGSSLRMARAAVFCPGTTLSSRSKMMASAALPRALAIFRSLSAGTNSQERGSLMPAFSG